MNYKMFFKRNKVTSKQLFYVLLNGSVAKNPPVNAGDAGDASLIAGLGRYTRVGNGKTHSSILA